MSASTLRLRAVLNRLRRRMWHALFFRMLFGEVQQGRGLPHTRISPSTCIEHEDRLHLADDVFIGHFNFIEASSGITIGAHCFIGPHSVIEAGTTLGKGCLVTAGSRVRGTFADFAVIGGNPAQVVGDTRTQDARWLAAHPEYLPAYESWAGKVQAL